MNQTDDPAKLTEPQDIDGAFLAAAEAVWADYEKSDPSDDDTKARAVLELGNLLLENEMPTFKGYRPDQIIDLGLEGDISDGALIGQLFQTKGLYFLGLGEGYRDDVLSKASECFHRSILEFDQSGLKEDGAASQIYLAFTLTEQFGGNQSERSEQAISLITKALKTLRRKDNVTLWANAKSALGSAYLERSKGGEKANLRQAALAFRATLRAFPEQKEPYGRAQAYVNLSSVAIKQIEFDGRNAVERAIRCCRAALVLCDGSEPSELPITALHNLATALSERQGRNVLQNNLKAEQHLADAISRASKTNPTSAKLLRLNRAVLLLDLGLNHGIDCLDDVAKMLERLNNAFDPSETLDWWLQHRWHRARLLMELDEPGQAAEIGREVLAQIDPILAATSDLDEKMRLIHSLSEVGDLAVVATLTDKGPSAAMETALLFDGKLFQRTYRAPDKLKKGHARIHLLSPSVDNLGLAIVQHKDGDELVMLPGLGKEYWDALTDKYPEALRHLTASPKGLREFRKFLAEWIADVSTALHPLWKVLAANNVQTVDLQARGAWEVASFAGFLNETSNWGNPPRVVCSGQQERSIRLKPASRVLHILDTRLTQGAEEQKVVLELFPDMVKRQSLAEVQGALQRGGGYEVIHFTCHGSHDFENIDDGGILCPDGEVLSARWVYENAKLKPGAIVVMAACETGISDFGRLPNEGFGLPSAFLNAGAGAVVSTLWPVGDLASRLFVTKFYREVLAGKGIGSAFALAQNYLREASYEDVDAQFRTAEQFRSVVAETGEREEQNLPFQHPLYWAGYTLHQG